MTPAEGLSIIPSACGQGGPSIDGLLRPRRANITLAPGTNARPYVK